MNCFFTILVAATLFFSCSHLIASGYQVELPSVSDPTEFKIDTEVFVEGSQSPVSINRTVFVDGLVFDFRLSDQGDKVLEATIFDRRNQRFVLLDAEREIRLLLDNLQLLRIVEGMKQELKQAEKTAFLTFEDAAEDFQIDAGRIKVENEFITYAATGERPEDDSILRSYFEFLEYYSRLSATDPHRLPPFARMRLNSALKKYGIMPGEVEMELRTSRYSREPFTAKSKHRVSLQLDADDRARIENAKKNWMRYRTVELSQYRDLPVSQSADEDEER